MQTKINIRKYMSYKNVELKLKSRKALFSKKYTRKWFNKICPDIEQIEKDYVHKFNIDGNVAKHGSKMKPPLKY